MDIAYENHLQTIENIALSHEKIVSCRATEIENYIIVAVLTVPIYLRSERDELKLELESTLQESTDKEVLFTYDMNVFRKISDDLTFADKKQLLETFK